MINIFPDNYKNYKIALCINATKVEETTKQVKEFILKEYPMLKHNIILIKNKAKQLLKIFHNINWAREFLRNYEVKNNFDYLFFLYTNTIPLNLN